MKLLIELRPGEGGEDAKLLVPKLASMYIKYAERKNLAVTVEDRGSL